MLTRYSLINSCSSTRPPCLHRVPCWGTSSMPTWLLALFRRLNQRGEFSKPPAHACVNESASLSLTYSRSCIHTHTPLLLYLKITFKSPPLGFLTVSLKNMAQEILAWSKDGTQWPKCFISDLVLSQGFAICLSPWRQ